MLCRELIGRDHVVASARAALADAERGDGWAAVVSGEAGVGKSRVVSDLIATARESGAQVLFGRAVQAETPVPFRPFAEALLSHFRSQGLPDDPELVPFRPALGRLLPEWRMPSEATHEPPVVLAEGVVRLLTTAAGDAATLLVVEDIHWADQETLAVLEYFADVLRTQPMLCVATLRTQEQSHGQRLVHDLAASRTATELQLSALLPEELRRMTADCLDAPEVSDDVVDFVRTWSDGLPFMVEEVLAGAVGSGALSWDGERWTFDPTSGPAPPATFLDNVRRRLEGLGPDAARVLRYAAVLGRRFDWSLLRDAVALTDLQMMAALRAGVDAQLLVAEPGGEFRFRHALTVDAVLGDLLPAELALVSRALLDVVEARTRGYRTRGARSPPDWPNARPSPTLQHRCSWSWAGARWRRAPSARPNRSSTGPGRCRRTPPRGPTSTRSPWRCWRSRARPTRRSSWAGAWLPSCARSTPRHSDVPTPTSVSPARR